MRDSADRVDQRTDLLSAVAMVGIAAAAWRYVSSRPAEEPRPDGFSPQPRNRAGTPDNSLHIQLDDSAESTAAATSAAMAHVLGRPDSIRQRALNAATISSAVIAVLALALLAQVAGSATESWRPWTLVFVILAPCLWIVTVGAFVAVVTLGPPREIRGEGYQAFVNAYEAYSDALRKRLRFAAQFSVVSLTTTAIAVGLVVIELTYVRERERRLVLTTRAMTAVAALCDWPVTTERRVNVMVSSDELVKQIVEMDVRSRPGTRGAPGIVCAAPTTELRIPRSAILAAANLSD